MSQNEPEFDFEAFPATSEQRVVKARFWKHMSEQDVFTDVTSMSMEDLGRLAGTLKLSKWANRDSKFMPWFLNRDAVQHKIAACAEVAIDSLLEILLNSDKQSKPADRIRAADLLATLAGLYPNHKKEVVFVDKEINNLDQDEVRKQISGYLDKMKLTEKCN